MHVYMCVCVLNVYVCEHVLVLLAFARECACLCIRECVCVCVRM